MSQTDLELTLYTRLVLNSETHCLPPGVPSSLFYFLFFFSSVCLYVCVCAVVEQFQLYILEFASNASLSLFHYGIVLNSWFSNLRFVCAGIAGVHHHTMLYFDDISSFFSLVICFYYHHILILTELIFSEFFSKSPVCLPGLFKKAWRHF